MSLTMFRNLALAAFGCAALGACGDGAAVADQAPQGEFVSVSGCPVVAANGCMTIDGGKGAIDLANASPKPDLTRGVTLQVSGHDTGQTNACGKVLADVKYDYLSFRCDVAPVAATTPAAPATGG